MLIYYLSDIHWFRVANIYFTCLLNYYEGPLFTVYTLCVNIEVNGLLAHKCGYECVQVCYRPEFFFQFHYGHPLTFTFAVVFVDRHY